MNKGYNVQLENVSHLEDNTREELRKKKLKNVILSEEDIPLIFVIKISLLLLKNSLLLN